MIGSSIAEFCAYWKACIWILILVLTSLFMKCYSAPFVQSDTDIKTIIKRKTRKTRKTSITRKTNIDQHRSHINRREHNQEINKCINQSNEYSTLHTLIMCPPTNFEDEKEGPAHGQHKYLVSVLHNLGIHIELLNPEPNNEELGAQVFTRDVGTVIGNKLFEGKMNNRRIAENPFFDRWVQEQKLERVRLSNNLEGGDVLVDGEVVWVGQSGRTSDAAIAELAKYLGSQFSVHALPFPADYLHLDCIFNILSPNDAIIYPSVFSSNDLLKIKKQYKNLIVVTSEEQKLLATNFLSIGSKIVVGSGRNWRIIDLIQRSGYKYIPVNVDKFVQHRGGVRCLTLPLCRS